MSTYSTNPREQSIFENIFHCLLGNSLSIFLALHCFSSRRFFTKRESSSDTLPILGQKRVNDKNRSDDAAALSGQWCAMVCRNMKLKKSKKTTCQTFVYANALENKWLTFFGSVCTFCANDSLQRIKLRSLCKLHFVDSFIDFCTKANL